ncbi:chemotaxis protein methyltransferase CheR [Hypnocyclicus thermotrophus]|uniref:protein-glutamate O-methyltransferase n=1 Tax=Hypnocyclicus thermotrophus TaxID=1627895 RepID=A0AA46DXR8_9FUSO|nr:protein-glutamate O-methyltransferase CheR [Hypnocyclicus thermotrophus]TDT68639.1 chemotaxis protein methyltransferase CheR [Hypnocyclicus thermotrophus]
MIIKIEMNDKEFELFRDYIYERSGIHYTINKKTILQNRVRRRLRDLELDSYTKYFNIIKNKSMSDPEVIKFFDEVTTNETSFFRHDKQFIALEKMVIPELLANRRISTINIWSAAASTGKEAYTIAAVLKEIPELKGKNIKILGTDLNQKVLNIAKEGKYDIKDIKNVEKKYLKYFDIDEKNGIVTVKNELKSLVTFKRFNLTDRFTSIPKMDIIFCRNVFIYFQKHTQKEIVDKFYDKLNPNGFFILGHSETLNGIDNNFTYRKFNNENLMIYQK